MQLSSPPRRHPDTDWIVEGSREDFWEKWTAYRPPTERVIPISGGDAIPVGLHVGQRTTWRAQGAE